MIVSACQKHTFQDHFFHQPLCENQTLLRKICNIAFNILTLGIPLAIYHVIKCCFPKSFQQIKNENGLQETAFKNVTLNKHNSPDNKDPVKQMILVKTTTENNDENGLQETSVNNVTLNKQNPPENHDPVKEMILLKTTTENNEIQKLTHEGKIQEAWKLYVESNLKDRYGEHAIEFSTRLKTWSSLPPEELISAIVDEWKDQEAVRTNVTIELIRDCALAYSSFRQKCLTENKLWDYFNAYPEYVADIAKKNVDFAYKIMSTTRGTAILDDRYRFEIFYGGYDQILSQIQTDKMTDEQMKYITAYLLRYRTVITDEDFARIKELAKKIKSRSQVNQNHEAMINFVIGKLSLQGIYKKGENLLQNFTDMSLGDIFHLSATNISECEINDRLAALDLDEEIEKAVQYLLFIPKNAPSYTQSRMALGHIWSEQGEFIEAGKCFLEAALITTTKDLLPKDVQENRRETLFLAASSLLMKATINNNEKLVMRLKDEDKNEGLFRALSPMDCDELASNTEKFLEILREEYKNHPDFVEILA